MTIPSTQTFLKVYAALMGLLSLSVALSFVPLGPMQTATAIAIAAIKAGLVAAFFMEILIEDAAVRLWVAAGFYWLAVLLVLSMADYMTRR